MQKAHKRDSRMTLMSNRYERRPSGGVVAEITRNSDRKKILMGICITQSETFKVSSAEMAGARPLREKLAKRTTDPGRIKGIVRLC